MAEKLPHELMESCLAASEDATFDGFYTSVLKEVFNDPQRRRIFQMVYRMGFQSGWRIRENLAIERAKPDSLPSHGELLIDGLLEG